MSHARKVIIELLLIGATGRNRLQGVFNFLRGRCDWDIRLPQTKEEFAKALEEPTDGIITSRVYSTDLLRTLEKGSAPVVFMDIDRLDRKDFRDHDVTVSNDNGGIGLAAGNYFHALGRFRAYGYVPFGTPQHWCARRCRGFAVALRRYRQSVQVFDAGKACLTGWLRSLPKPAAIFCSCDARARATLEACRQARIKVPDQVAILGVDNDELICQIARPNISSIRPDTEGEGFAAAKALHAIMNGSRKTGQQTILLKPLGIVERASTHPPPPAAHLVQTALSIIQQDSTKGLSADDVAKRVGCSRRLLDLRFAEFHEESVHAALVRARLKAVRRELALSDRKFIHIARECGFKNAAVLKNLFRKVYGMSMRDFRKEATAEP